MGKAYLLTVPKVYLSKRQTLSSVTIAHISNTHLSSHFHVILFKEGIDRSPDYVDSFS